MNDGRIAYSKLGKSSSFILFLKTVHIKIIVLLCIYIYIYIINLFCLNVERNGTLPRNIELSRRELLHLVWALPPPPKKNLSHKHENVDKRGNCVLDLTALKF